MELTKAWVREHLPKRKADGHKGDFGKVLCICGSVGYTGAPIFASRAAMRCGSGLVFLGVPESIYAIAAIKSDEAMPFPLPDEEGKLSLAAENLIRQKLASCDALLVGCGMGRSESSDRLVRNLLSVDKPLVLDADGINALQGHTELLKSRTCITVLTPHEGEFSRIGKLLPSRESSAERFAKTHNVYLILKGHRTVITAPDGRIAVNPTGNCGMAKGGSGDVLSGMVLSLLGQGAEPFSACCSAVYLHGLAGDIAAAEKTEYAMTPSDLLECIPNAFKEVLK
jgi:hydroxyethylthiazole kinase-like uncharacterized protein yjeF